MGIVLGTEAAIGIAEAVEAGTAAAEAGEAVAGAAEAGEAISTGAEAGAEAGTEAAGEAAETALEEALSKLAQAGQKIAKMVVEYMAIDDVFKAANAILKALREDPKAHERAVKLTLLIDVLNTTGDILKALSDWLTTNASKEVTVQDYVVSIQGVLSKFIPQIGSSAAVLKKLSDEVSKKNVKKDPVTDGELDALEKGLTTVLQSLKQLAEFKEEHCSKITILKEMPIDTSQVSSLESKMPA